MNPEEILFFKIEAYLRDRLSPADRTAFESEMDADPDLAALVQRQQRENQALELLTERELRARMGAWERQMPATTLQTSGGRYRSRWIAWAAAAAVLVLIAGWWIVRDTGRVEAPVVVQPQTPATSPTTVPKSTPKPGRQQQPTSPAKDIADNKPASPAPAPKPTAPAPSKKAIDYAALSDEYYRERDFFPATTNPGTGAAGYDQAVQDFKKGKYSDLLSQLRKGGKFNANDLNVKELLGHSLLKNRQYDAAVNTFREIVNTRRQPYADKAEWALALVYLKQMPAKSALLDRALERITARPGHLFYGKAKALQERVKQ